MYDRLENINLPYINSSSQLACPGNIPIPPVAPPVVLTLSFKETGCCAILGASDIRYITYRQAPSRRVAGRFYFLRLKVLGWKLPRSLDTFI